MIKLTPWGTLFPAKKGQIFSTREDQQTAVTMQVCAPGCMPYSALHFSTVQRFPAQDSTAHRPGSYCLHVCRQGLTALRSRRIQVFPFLLVHLSGSLFGTPR